MSTGYKSKRPILKKIESLIIVRAPEVLTRIANDDVGEWALYITEDRDGRGDSIALEWDRKTWAISLAHHIGPNPPLVDLHLGQDATAAQLFDAIDRFAVSHRFPDWPTDAPAGRRRARL